MCEILFLYFLGKKIYETAENKGRPGILFVLLLIGLWFGGEIFGAVVGTILVKGNQESLGPVYVCALFGAAAGAILSFVIAGIIPAAGSGDDRPRRRHKPRRAKVYDDEDDDDRPRRRRSDDEDEGRITDKPRGRRRSDDEDDEDDRPRRKTYGDYDL